MASENREILCFGEFRLDIGHGRLLCRGRDMPLRPKAWEVLCYLAARPRQVVSIDELLDSCWKGLHVGPHTVTNVIYALRAVFSAGHGEAEWIQSVARRGYRFTAPVRVTHALSDAVAQPVEDASRSDEPPDALFVGRQRETALLHQRWQQVLNRTPRVVFIAGEPGIGKTALVRRFCATTEPPQLLCIGRCIPQHREAEPYMPVLEALGPLASRPELLEVAREQAPTWLIQMPWLLAKEERTALRQALSGIGAPRMLREGKRLFAGLAEQSALLLVLEDVHWADSATVDLMRALAESDTPSRLMLIATYRPSEIVVRDHPLRRVVSELSARARTVDVLSLETLTPAQVQEYLARRFSSPCLAAEIAFGLEERSGGNPLFLEAMTNYLCEQRRIVQGEQGWHLAIEPDELEVGLPEGLREMIRTHLRRIAPEDVRVLEAASATGADFNTLEVAAALALPAAEAEAACERIAHDGHFIRPVGNGVWPDGSVVDTYRFAHVAYQQVLSDDLSPSRRRLLHARIGQRLESAFGTRAREIAPRLASHFEAAADLEREAEYLKLCVQLAAGRYAHRETLAYIDRMLHVLGQLPVTDDRAMLQLGWLVERGNLILAWQGFAAGYDSFTRAVELARRRGNSFLEFVGRAGCCFAGLMVSAHRLEARTQPEMLLAIAADGHPELETLAHLLAGTVCDSFGDPAGAVSHADAALAALPYRLIGLPRGSNLETLMHVLLAASLMRMGQLDRARRERTLAIQSASAEVELHARSHAFAFLACEALLAAEPALALDLAERTIDSAREGGFANFLVAGEAARDAAKIALAADGTIDGSVLERLEATVEERRRLDENWYNMLLAGYLAEGYRRAGDLDKARARVDASFDRAEVVLVPELWRIKAEIELAGARTRHVESAARCFESAIDLARQHGTKLFELRSTIALTRLRQGGDGMRERLAAIYGSFPENLVAPDLHAAATLLR